MEFEVPAYRESFGATHNSASGGTQPLDEHILKLYLRKEYKMNFPFGARPRAGQIVQEIADHAVGLHEYSPIYGRKQGIGLPEAIRYGMTEFMSYMPRQWDDGKDAEEYEEIKEHIGEMGKHAVDGLNEYFGDGELEGEYQRWHQDDRLDVPVMLYQDYCGDGKQIDLKCSFPIRNPLKKDGTRTWRVPKPRSEPTEQQLMQQAVYWKATGDKPALLYVTAAGFNIVDETNCEAMKTENLERKYEEIVMRWTIIQNLLKAANGSWRTLFGLVQPDFAQIAQRHGPDIIKIAKEAWRI